MIYIVQYLKASVCEKINQIVSHIRNAANKQIFINDIHASGNERMPYTYMHAAVILLKSLQCASVLMFINLYMCEH